MIMNTTYKKKEFNQQPSNGRIANEPHPDAQKNFEYFKKKMDEYALHKDLNFRYEKSEERTVFNPLNGKHETVTSLIEPIYIMFSWKIKGINQADVFSFHDHWHGDFCEACDDLFDWMERKYMAKRKEKSLEQLRSGY
jgi:hypothetical protein